MATTFPMDARHYRDVLGHFPTGVAVVTAIDAGGTPIGMAVGSFTSVSLDPPLVAFLPDKGSSTFPRIRDAGSFCVNVLASTQESVCRAFARKGADKFAGISWRPAPSGAPIIDGIVAWIDCTIEEVHEAGDHYIALGRVSELQVANPTLPLLFFQGGYGAFALGSVVAGASEGRNDQIVLADRVRAHAERLARTAGIEVEVFAPTAESLVLVASATPTATSVPSRVGIQLPLAPPRGRLFVAWEDRDAIETWYAKIPVHSGRRPIEEMDRALASARRHGWVPNLQSDALDDVWETMARIAELGRTPGLDRRLAHAIDNLGALPDPADIDAESAGKVQALSAPIFGDDGKVALIFTLAGIPLGTSLERIRTITRDLVDAAQRASTSIGGHWPIS